jgi:hypothetical protein
VLLLLALSIHNGKTIYQTMYFMEDADRIFDVPEPGMSHEAAANRYQTHSDMSASSDGFRGERIVCILN